MSFSYTALQRMERLAPAVPVVQLIDKPQYWPMLRRVMGHDWLVGPGIELLHEHPRLAERIAASGHDVHVWTVNTEADLRLCQELGVKAVITDRPAYLLELLDRVASRAHGQEVAHQGPRGADSPGEVGPRQPCPCGSGKRYKACHGAEGGAAAVYVAPARSRGCPRSATSSRMRELVPSATAPLTVKGTDQPVTLCSLLPMAAPAMVRDSGQLWLGLQVQHNFGDPSRDLAAVLAARAGRRRARRRRPHRPARRRAAAPGPGRPTTSSTVTVHEGFDFWIADVDDKDDLAAALEQANAAASPTARLTQVEAAYWTDVGTKEHLRWVMPEPEDPLLDALARLHVAGQDVIVEGARLVGMFRAHGLLAPVWDLPLGTGPEALEDPASTFAEHLAEALADDSDLTADQRAARSGLANRQVTIR